MAEILPIHRVRTIATAFKEAKWLSADRLRLLHAKRCVDFVELRELETVEVFAELDSREDSTKSFANGKPGNVTLGESLDLRVPKRLNVLFIAKALDELITVWCSTGTEPKAYLLIQDGESPAIVAFDGGLHGDSTDENKNFHSAIRLWGRLVNVADVVSGDGSTLHFVATRKTSIVRKFSQDECKGALKIDEIERFLLDEDKRDAKREIFRAVLCDFLKDHEEKSAFPWILRAASSFGERLHEGLSIYLAEHSPEKLAEAARKSGLEVADRLEKLVSGLEVKSLSIPAAILLSFKEIEISKSWTAANTTILISTVLFAATMVFVHISQLSILRVLNSSVQKITSEAREKGLQLKNPVFNDLLTNLQRRICLVKSFSWVMVIASSLPLIIVIISIWFLSPEM